MIQPWFRRFTRAVEPASPLFHPCFSQVPLRHGPRVFGEGLAGLPAGTGYETRRRSTCRASATSSGSASRSVCECVLGSLCWSAVVLLFAS